MRNQVIDINGISLMDNETTNSSINNHDFIINGHVRFIPFRRIIEDMNTGTKIKLHVPASLCLDRLLNNQGRLVSQDELILCAWGLKRESTVSSNTFYQCILHLRRKLAQMGLFDVIETVPRHGIIFNNSVSVSISRGEPLSLPIDESNQTQEKNSETNVETSQLNDTDENPCINEDESLLSSIDLTDASRSPSIFMVPQKRSLAGMSYTSISIIILLTLMVILGFIYITFNKNNVFDYYIKLPSNNCFIYSTDNRYSTEEITSILENAGLSCLNKENIFFTASPLQSKINIIHCSTHNKKQQNCRSVTIVSELKEK
ncbi:hypothetical protein C0Q87_21420 [Klebsiella aerogenes]|nr:hypothetical protein C0Q87_21420 [Klebsiella aerogenes]